MKNRSSFLPFLLLVFGISSCSMLPPAALATNSPDGKVQIPYGTISALLTETAVLTPSVTQPAPTSPPHTPSAEATHTLITRPTLDLRSPGSTQPVTPSLPGLTDTPTNRPHGDSQVVAAPCNLAQPGRPLDVTVQDESQFAPGEYFSKTWRLVNAGECAWDRDYAVVWFSGEDMGVTLSQPLGVRVEPGNTIDVTVDMLAPVNPGLYQSNWKLRSSQGEMFGIGPNGGSPFWVRIVVIPVGTPTATQPEPSVTPTPMLFLTGLLQLLPEQGVDFDSGLTGSPDREDLVFQLSAEGEPALRAVNGARLVRFEGGEPAFEDCHLSTLASGEAEPQIEALSAGAHLCYRTNEGLPGRIFLTAFDPDQSQLTLEFTTWAVP